MKKIISILLAGLTMITLFGCANKETSTKQNSKNVKEEINYVAYGNGENSGNWNIKINNVCQVNEVAKKDGGKFTADGKFINILLDMKNISKNPVSYSLTDFKLKDISTGKIYSIEDVGYEVAQELISEEKFYKKNEKYITIMDKVNPDKAKIACISFDVSKDIKLDNLVLINKNEGSDSKTVQFKLK
ncbi:MULTISPECIES: DUF4352 domain-containing protein [Clostridium]|uniref:DUF4352 domain-containing protein n=1 Tax=Clostridium TaxID=1485 RepID=UPI000773B39F|nr:MULTISPECIES: DUF4352 domain-containing protein [Clostridium]AUM96154.1 hypothetical protein RSJ11_13740 [Clostridium sporogenes]AVQ53606.1 DUF4352 domain-containing protein [Clostridium botulinum]